MICPECESMEVYVCSRGAAICQYCTHIFSPDYDGAPREQWEVTTPPDVYWNGVDSDPQLD